MLNPFTHLSCFITLALKWRICISIILETTSTLDRFAAFLQNILV